MNLCAHINTRQFQKLLKTFPLHVRSIKIIYPYSPPHPSCPTLAPPYPLPGFSQNHCQSVLLTSSEVQITAGCRLTTRPERLSRIPAITS